MYRVRGDRDILDGDGAYKSMTDQPNVELLSTEFEDDLADSLT